MSHAEKQCGICAGLENIRAGKAPNLIAELDNSYVVLGDAQFYRGYCILLAKHHAQELFELPLEEARGLADELRSVAKAIYNVVKPLKLNYECLGNLEPHVHWHVFPRYESEEEKLRRAPVWERPASERMRALEETRRARADGFAARRDRQADSDRAHSARLNTGMRSAPISNRASPGGADFPRARADANSIRCPSRTATPASSTRGDAASVIRPTIRMR